MRVKIFGFLCLAYRFGNFVALILRVGVAHARGIRLFSITIVNIVRDIDFFEFAVGSNHREYFVEHKVNQGGDAKTGEKGHLIYSGGGKRDGGAS